MLEEYVEDNYYARFETHSYHRYREMHFNARLDLNCWHDGRTNGQKFELLYRTLLQAGATKTKDFLAIISFKRYSLLSFPNLFQQFIFVNISSESHKKILASFRTYEFFS